MKTLKYTHILLLLLFAGSFSGLAQTDTLKPGLPDDEVIRMRNELVEALQNDNKEEAARINDKLWTSQPKNGIYLSVDDYYLVLFITSEFDTILASLAKEELNVDLSTKYPKISYDLKDEGRKRMPLIYAEINKKYTFNDRLTLSNLLLDLVSKNEAERQNADEIKKLSYETIYEYNTSSLKYSLQNPYTPKKSDYRKSRYRKKNGEKHMKIFDIGWAFTVTNDIPAMGLKFLPSINIKEWKKDRSLSLSLTIGSIPLGGGGWLDASLCSNINLGFGAKQWTLSNTGFFIGLGPGYSYLWYFESHQAYYNKAWGLSIETGIRFKIDGDGMLLKGSYLINFNTEYKNVWQFGMYASIF